MKVVRRWDLAASEDAQGSDPDWTVGCKVALGDDGTFYVVDMQRFRDSPGRVEKKVLATAGRDGHRVKIRMEQEPGAAGKTVISHYRRRVLRAYQFKGRRSTGDKTLRAELAASHSENGDVKVVRGPWNAEFFRELTRFPYDAHDDQVDAFAGAIDDLVSKSGTISTW
jgi:predicted phage terminase large subunit-like protein